MNAITGEAALSGQLNTVNRHYLDRAIDLGERYDVCASEDIYDANGVKLLAKGAKLSSGMQERLIRHKLRKPLESSLTVADGVGTAQVLEIAKELLDELPPLQASVGEGASSQALLGALERIGLNASMTTLLTMAYKSEGQRHFRHTVLVALIATAMALRARLSADEVQIAAHAGLLHDIGEMYLDPAYLKSAAHLKPEEWKHVVVHPKVGQLVLTELTPYPAKVARAVGEHHERLDGSGYPHRHASRQISREGSIVAAAEALGGIFMRPHDPLRHACLSLRIMPGEFAPEVVSVLACAARAMPAPSASGVRPADEQQAQLGTLNQKLESVLEHCAAIAASPLASKRFVVDAQQRVVDRIHAIRRSLASSGVGDLLQDPRRLSDDPLPEILLELEVVPRELEWRLRDLGRDLVLHLPQQDAELQSLFADLIATLDGSR